MSRFPPPLRLVEMLFDTLAITSQIFQRTEALCAGETLHISTKFRKAASIY